MRKTGDYQIISLVTGILCSLALVGASRNGLDHPVFSLIPELRADMTIGVEDGDENYIFGSIVRVELDGAGRIYVLDYKYRCVRIFDPGGMFLRLIKVPEGQGPTESVELSGIAVSPKGVVFINDQRKIIVYGPDGQYVRTFLLYFDAMSIGCAGSEELMAIGPWEGKILHEIDPTGKVVASFGEYFQVPFQLASFEGSPMFSAPATFNCSRDGRIFVMNPHKYEIKVFQNRFLKHTMSGKSDVFRPVTKMGRGLVTTAAHIIASGKYVFIKLQGFVPKGGNRLDVFENGIQEGSIEIHGIPRASDAQEHIYIVEDEDYPKIVRYRVIDQ